MAKDIYLISGLGADRRVFEFLDLTAFNVHYIDWIDPFLGESIQGYSKRLLRQVASENPILIGVSFGGLIAIEIGKQITTERIILISSVKTRSAIPFLYRVVGSIALDRIIPASLFKRVNGLSYWFFGVKSDSEKKLLKSIIEETDSKFLKWAIHEIVTWKNAQSPRNLYHIHGDVDRILLSVTENEIIKGGGHLMIMNRAQEIFRLINNLI